MSIPNISITICGDINIYTSPESSSQVPPPAPTPAPSAPAPTPQNSTARDRPSELLTPDMIYPGRRHYQFNSEVSPLFNMFIPFLGADLEIGIQTEETTTVPSTDEVQNGTQIFISSETNHESICSICHNAIERGDTVRQITNCGHFFHQTCIDRWFSQSNTCPICRECISR